jgi:hypothetical protein
MSRKEMIRFLRSKNVFASTKDSTERLHKKMARYEHGKKLEKLDRLAKKISKRIRRANRKGGSIPRWMVEVLRSGNPEEAIWERAKKEAHLNCA